MKFLILTVLVTLAVLSYSEGKPIEDEVVVDANQAVVSDDGINEVIGSEPIAVSDDVINEVSETKPIEVIESEPIEVIESEPVEVIESEVNFEEVGNHFEGDMQMTPGEIRRLFAKTGLVDTRSRWPKISGLVTVPYTIRAGQYNANQVNAIRVAMNEIQSRLCIRFVQRTTQADFIEIISGSGCSSAVGRRGGRQELSLKSNGCLSKGTIQHELIHALGFTHMQSHTDRDSYVRILYENIPGGTSNINFLKYDRNYINNLNTPYDFESVMHYPRNAFGIGGRDTVVPRDARYLNVIGQRNVMSAGDIRRISNMYQC